MTVLPVRNNAQHQPLTTVLRNIIIDYPAGGGVLRELCQNADDAGATRVEFVLDTKCYETENILNSGLAGYQGPALLAFNDSTFSETDFESLSRIGDSAKVKDLSATGKFGRGFNSVSLRPRFKPTAGLFVNLTLGVQLD
jgi:sacsin